MDVGYVAMRHAMGTGVAEGGSKRRALHFHSSCVQGVVLEREGWGTVDTGQWGGGTDIPVN